MEKILDRRQEYQRSAEKWLPAVAENLEHEEGYVRASAFKLLTALAPHDAFHASINQAVIPRAAGYLRDEDPAILASAVRLLVELTVGPGMREALERSSISPQDLGFVEGLDWAGVGRFSGVWSSLREDPLFSRLTLGARSLLRWELLRAARRGEEVSVESLNWWGGELLRHLLRLERMDEALGLSSVGTEVGLAPAMKGRAVPIVANLASQVGSHALVPAVLEGEDLLDVRFLPAYPSVFSGLVSLLLKESWLKRVPTVGGHYSVGADAGGEVVTIVLALFFGDPDLPLPPLSGQGAEVMLPGGYNYRGQTLDPRRGVLTDRIQSNFHIRPLRLGMRTAEGVAPRDLFETDLEAVAWLGVAAASDAETPLGRIYAEFKKGWGKWLEGMGGGSALLGSVEEAERLMAGTSGAGHRESTAALSEAASAIYEVLHGIPAQGMWRLRNDFAGEKDTQRREQLGRQIASSEGQGRQKRSDLQRLVESTLEKLRSAQMGGAAGDLGEYRSTAMKVGDKRIEELVGEMEEKEQKAREALTRQFPGPGNPDFERRFLSLQEALDLSRAAGMEERVLKRVTEAWREVVTTPAYEGVTKRILPVFFKGTYPAISLAAKSGNPFLVVTNSRAGLEEVQQLLDRMGVGPTQYRVWVAEDPLATLDRAEREFSDRFHIYPVSPQRPDWLRELLAGLKEMGILPIGDWKSAIQATERYFGGFV